MILDKIVEKKKEEIKIAKQKMPISILKKDVWMRATLGAFKRAIHVEGQIKLIAEVKKSSPSKGVIVSSFNPLDIACKYQSAGASAISVLTDERFFDGKLEYMKNIKDRVTIPVLRKDFIIDEYQIYESLVNHADAILLIARILTFQQLKDYQDIAKELGLDCLVEVHDEEDIEKALKSGSSVIGINNRDLSSFNVDIITTEKLIKYLPADKVIVSESGIANYRDVMFLQGLGVDAILVGESLLSSKDIILKVREILGHGV
ncbi:indole-3-glycerol phosphate synthase [Candidatus Omnitrophus magneticus]|uniref:Indole-3-glycerol phosphate synthase n=1 Tax=Candidatus Omnitrophus magneticus TaxID=1609969 RepID=A0A0F0CTW5_9BACT|nr:indole-3-glycerol phosphate synthase [Candidatus Omnitrophus magneticus]